MNGAPRSSDHVAVTHAHGGGDQPMQAVDDERIDGLRVREYTCVCGFTAAVLNRVEDEEPGAKWPFNFRPTSPPA
jgi:hypothetical protein